jgi:hypothetical protein
MKKEVEKGAFYPFSHSFFFNNSFSGIASWAGYQGDWQTLSFD